MNSPVQGLATADHTTLLLNCYTKAKDVEKLDRFLKGAERHGASGTLHFSIDTAVKVSCPLPLVRTAGADGKVLSQS